MRLNENTAKPLLLATSCALALLTAAYAQTRGSNPEPYTTWSDYGGSADSMQYSALVADQSRQRHNARAGLVLSGRGEPVRLPFNPLIVDDVMYVAGAKNLVVALDAVTGKELWTSTEEATERGLAYWESRDRAIGG